MQVFKKAVAVLICLCLSAGALAACVNGDILSDDAEYFIYFVELIEADGVTSGSLEDLEYALEYYDGLSDGEKENKDVISAKAKLDAFLEEYNALQSGKDFLSKASAVPAASAVTLADLGKITAAETAYGSLTAAQKEPQAIKDAYAKVAAARDAYNALAASDTKIKAFVSAVNALTVTLDSMPAIEAAFGLFNGLSAAEKADAAVVAAKSALDGKNTQYNQFRGAADEFLTEANALNGVTQYTTDELNAILVKYNGLPEQVKSDAGIIAAKALLDSEMQRMEPINASADAAAFIALTDGLPVTFSGTQLSDLTAISAAEAAYGILSNTAKAQAGVAAAYAKVTEAKGFYDDIKAAADFIAQANLLPETITAADSSKITAAENFYGAMSERAKTVAGVAGANEKVLAAREAYSKIPTQQLPVFFGLVLYPESISDGGFVWGDPNEQLSAYKTLYGNASMTNAALLEKVDFAVYFYQSNATQTSAPVLRYVLQDSGSELLILLRTRIREILTAADIPNGSYKMTIIGEDKTGQFQNSGFPGFTSTNYVFAR